MWQAKFTAVKTGDEYGSCMIAGDTYQEAKTKAVKWLCHVLDKPQLGIGAIHSFGHTIYYQDKKLGLLNIAKLN